MHMQQIEPAQLRDFRHARGERERIRRILKQRIGRNFNLVIEDTRCVGIQPDRVCIADEVHLVPTLRELEP